MTTAQFDKVISDSDIIAAGDVCGLNIKASSDVCASYIQGSNICGKHYGDGSSLSGVGGSPGGTDTQVQFNSSNTFGASPNFIWDSGNEVVCSNRLCAVTTVFGSDGKFANVCGSNVVQAQNFCITDGRQYYGDISNNASICATTLVQSNGFCNTTGNYYGQLCANDKIISSTCICAPYIQAACICSTGSSF